MLKYSVSVSGPIFRIAYDWSFDDAISEDYGCKVKAYDPRWVLVYTFRFNDRFNDSRVITNGNGVCFLE